MKHLRLILGIMPAVAVVAITYAATGGTWGGSNPTVGLEAGDTDPREATLEITYIANEGVLISSCDKQVLIDGLHREYKRAYAFLPAGEREKIELAHAPFDEVDLILVSHVHFDHFHPESIGLHLMHNPEAMLVSSHQVVEAVEKNFNDYAAIKSRVTGATPLLKERIAMKAAAIDFDVHGLGHGSGRHDSIQNLGHVIRMGGKKLRHLGDAAPSTEIFETFNLDEEGIDIAFIPSGFLNEEYGQALVRTHIKSQAYHRGSYLTRPGRECCWEDQKGIPKCRSLYDLAGKVALLSLTAN